MDSSLLHQQPARIQPTNQPSIHAIHSFIHSAVHRIVFHSIAMPCLIRSHSQHSSHPEFNLHLTSFPLYLLSLLVLRLHWWLTEFPKNIQHIFCWNFSLIFLFLFKMNLSFLFGWLVGSMESKLIGLWWIHYSSESLTIYIQFRYCFGFDSALLWMDDDVLCLANISFTWWGCGKIQYRFLLSQTSTATTWSSGNSGVFGRILNWIVNMV